MESAHRVEVGGECIGVSGLQLLDKALDVSGDDVFGGLPLLRLFQGGFADGGNGGLVVVFMGASSLGVGLCTSALKRGMYMPNATWRRRG